MTASSITIGDRIIGPGKPCFIIAEAGVNHDGDMDLAHRLIDVAADAGADAVKFQTYVTDLLVTADAPKAAYQIDTTGSNESQWAMLKRLELPRAAHPALKTHAEDRGLVFLSTPFEESSADFLASLGVAAFKIPSQELTNLPFVRHVARIGRPMIVSTGNGDMEEVAAASKAISAAGAPYALLHCVSQYPADIADANLSAMASLASVFGVPVGYSDHTLGLTAPIVAAALGATIIEKHYTIDRKRPGPDHRASLEPDDLADMVKAVRDAERSLGDGVKRPMPSESDVGRVARKSLVAARDLDGGRVLEAGDIAIRRPGTGLSPAFLDLVIGRRLRHGMKAGDLLALSSLE